MKDRALANCRDFTPLYGIHGRICHRYRKWRTHLLPFDVEAGKTYKIIQGETMNRTSEIHAKVSLKGNMYKASVGGMAKIVAEGKLLL